MQGRALVEMHFCFPETNHHIIINHLDAQIWKLSPIIFTSGNFCSAKSKGTAAHSEQWQHGRWYSGLVQTAHLSKRTPEEKWVSFSEITVLDGSICAAVLFYVHFWKCIYIYRFYTWEFQCTQKSILRNHVQTS